MLVTERVTRKKKRKERYCFKHAILNKNKKKKTETFDYHQEKEKY